MPLPFALAEKEAGFHLPHMCRVGGGWGGTGVEGGLRVGPIPSERRRRHGDGRVKGSHPSHPGGINNR